MLRRGYCEDAETCCCGGVGGGGGGGGGGGALGNFKTLLLPPKRSVSAAMSDQSGYEDSDSSSVGGGRQLTGKQQQQQQSHGAGSQCGAQAQYTDYRVQRGAEPAAAEAAGQQQEEEGATAKERHGDAESLNSGNTGTRTPLCRICFQGPEKGELLNPCRCNGSVRWTHQPCLLTWISERGSWSCELCYYKFRVRPVNTKHPTQWQGVSLSPIERVQAAAVSLGCLFLLASLVWLVWSGLSPAATWQRRDVLFQICYALYGLMDIVCIGTRNFPPPVRDFKTEDECRQHHSCWREETQRTHTAHALSGLHDEFLSQNIVAAASCFSSRHGYIRAKYPLVDAHILNHVHPRRSVDTGAVNCNRCSTENFCCCSHLFRGFISLPHKITAIISVRDHSMHMYTQEDVKRNRIGNPAWQENTTLTHCNECAQYVVSPQYK
ncbi:uncharacterized protein LOC116938631 isoform X2 [Petromyzon marinus]|uniref:uncharacterized protein LOC116938631 isoform X2 n=1 Tax=Petromyzon marinus TaxID=7757 RepID=UPI003F728839